MNTLAIINATEKHAAEVARLFDAYRVWYGKASDADGALNYITQRLRQNESVIFLATVDGAAAGFVQLYPLFSSISMGPVWILNDLFVAEDFRQQGIGTLLLETATEFGRESGALRLHLETGPQNFGAQKLYEAHGWKKDDEFFCYSLELS
ncbi:GNAT family N-acetyltransferase [Fuerstiella marisgermanici]|uniref:Aminoglycoside N(6')-acetyltransferase type 1 n=1 Tax=Fuerstiella marisgermanici TaxID=1891926 RepID=A0A1P8WEH3_9PLAN|nr:GNAT family N-acetyltransferase [Fuerstiella marisgermanici]APZ92473.1 Aminoglycoside N(6')-acetyltransferase type 1 [Fuerstiella marisgermanici]